MAKIKRAQLKTMCGVPSDTKVGICIPVYNAVDNQHLATTVFTLEQGSDLDYQLSLGIGPNCVAKNRNKALERIDPEIRYIVMADDDIVASPFWASKMVSTLEQFTSHGRNREEQRYGMVSATMMGPRGEPQNHIHPDRIPPGEVQDVGLVPGTFIMYDRVLCPIEWDENYKQSQWEDTDAAMQVQQFGYKVAVNGNVQIIHKSPLKAVGGQVWDENKAYFQSKWPGVVK